ncbi:uncharacterized protein CXQ87_000696 [Candidozyma duobushaemuli]|nr:uncharacterized protein CXQ87_000696 [[Candida] duobushaemulonis]PVH17798.1 hypothetical protein CXQ87_000696 [[Candida] duobushaemulonis]
MMQPQAGRGQPSFHFEEDGDNLRVPPNKPFAINTSRLNASSLSRTTSNSTDFSNINSVLQFPIENSHSYSYAHLSPNSLALRLNVLKRSLEILNERPDWFRSINYDSSNNSDDDLPGDSMPSWNLQPSDNGHRRVSARSVMYHDASRNASGESINLSSDRCKIRPNASSAALSMLFRPQMARADSLPASRFPSSGSARKDLKVSTTNLSSWKQEEAKLLRDISSPGDTMLSDDLQDIIQILENDSSELDNNTEIASTLHDLSLSSGEHDHRAKKNILKSKLLLALATPFVESTSSTSSLLDSATPQSAAANPPVSTSTASLTLLNSLNSPLTPSTGNRPFHVLSSGKHSSPQSVFTVEDVNPWNLKAANDLACLMFGVSKNMIKNLTLMDLIAPQFRHFVTERLTKSISDSLDRNGAKSQIILAGEIIAISRQADHTFAWTSMWAKKRGNLIICMFEQIPCDAFDIVVQCDVEKYPHHKYSVASVQEIAGKLLTSEWKDSSKTLEQVSNSLDHELTSSASSHSKESTACDFRDSETINKIRYFTLQARDDNIPCAVTSYPLELNDDKYEIKLKFHSMPYIAGMFVVNFSDYDILSSNNAIANNLFGKSSEEILHHSIDEIIPGFTKILETGLKDQNDISIMPGLVLPEHFFRKYDAVLKHRDSQEISMEELFFKSKGISGIHRDGKPLSIDVQLRVISSDVFVLWVTYSRHSKNIASELDKLTRSASSRSLTSSPRQRSNSDVSGNDLPSQLRLFPENEDDLMELGHTSPHISRANSTRRPKKANTFSIPVTYMGNDVDSNTLKVPGQFAPRSSSTRASQDSRTSVESAESGDTESEPTTHTNYSSETRYTRFTEEELLNLENEDLKQKMKRSKEWPASVGAKRRTKKFEEFKVLKKLGEGAYGKVVLAEHKEDPAYRIIIKCIDKQRILVDTWVRDRQLGTIPSEIQVMATLNHEPHPNIMRIIDYFEDPNYYYLETPIFGDPPAIDLFDYIEVKKDMSEIECQYIFTQIVNAIYHLHKNGIVHRDIKDENVIVDERGIIKLIDFGSAGYVKSGPFDVFVGTIDYASPEVLRGEKYEGKPQDIWALGILLYTMIYKENPFYNVDEIMEGDLRVPYVVSEKSLALIEKILVRDINKRPTITDIIEDEWLDI